MTVPSLTTFHVGAATRRRLALCLDTIAAGCLIAGTGAIVAIADTRTFGISHVYVAAVAVTAPILGLVYVLARRLTVDPAQPLNCRPKPISRPQSDRELRRRLGRWVVELMVWFCTLNVVLLPGNLVVVANRWLDRSPPVDTAFVVEGKRWLRKYKGAYFIMSRAGSKKSSGRESVTVSKALFDRIVPNRTKVVLTMHDGAFGFPWTKPADLRWSDLAPPS